MPRVLRGESFFSHCRWQYWVPSYFRLLISPVRIPVYRGVDRFSRFFVLDIKQILQTLMDLCQILAAANTFICINLPYRINNLSVFSSVIKWHSRNMLSIFYKKQVSFDFWVCWFFFTLRDEKKNGKDSIKLRSC